ncbi:MAG TPA: glycosyltransferase family 2 protein [Planctomycetota bacterium]|nr:glycosyltransferase family 2 protein [Planctomycetota bacterium]
MSAPDLSVVVLSWNTREWLRRCLAALAADGTRLRRETIVVDNASSDGSPEAVEREFPWARCVRNARNEGYARGNNLGLALARGAFLCTLNSDAAVRPLALDRLVAYLRAHADCGAAAPKLLNPDGSVQPACMRFPRLSTALFFDTFLDRLFPRNGVVARYFMRDVDPGESRDVEQPPGACLVLRREAIEAVGPFDEDLWLFFNDVDLCLRLARAGWRIRYLAEAEVVHEKGASTSKYPRFAVEWHKNRLAYYRKHYGPAGALVVRAAVAARGIEEALRIRRRTPRGASRREEMRRLRLSLAEVLLGRKAAGGVP